MRVWIVDAFTDRPFAGNPAGVCLLETPVWPDEAWMRSVAGELNAETAFVYSLDGTTGSKWGLRWFTQWAESNVCGHATLATAHVLHRARELVGPLSFHSQFGVLAAHIREDGAITLDFPAAELIEVPLPDELPEALGAQPASTCWTGTLGDLLVRLGEEDEIGELRPSSAAAVELCRRESLRGIVVTAPAQDQDSGYDFVSRWFGPEHGALYEDAVTGSAYTALAPYWAPQLGRNTLTGLQASARTGLVHTELHGNRVSLTGSAVTTIEGVMHLSP
jgi:PhzF family phenazine biosynthesis protein